MLTQKRKQSGFTLIELLVVVIIVAVLAAVGLPLMSGNINRARASEADAGLGNIRTQFRAMLAEGAPYSPTVTTGAVLTSGLPGVAAGDFTGRYFDDDDFTIQAVTASTFCANVTYGSGAIVAPKAGLAGVTIAHSMNEKGDLFNNGTCTAPAINQ